MGGGLGWGLVLQRTERTLVAGVEERNMDEIKRERRIFCSSSRVVAHCRYGTHGHVIQQHRTCSFIICSCAGVCNYYLQCDFRSVLSVFAAFVVVIISSSSSGSCSAIQFGRQEQQVSAKVGLIFFIEANGLKTELFPDSCKSETVPD